MQMWFYSPTGSRDMLHTRKHHAETTPMGSESAPKTICPTFLGSGGHNKNGIVYTISKQPQNK